MDENIDTSGFYKLENGQLMYAHESVMNNDFKLKRAAYQSYEYPIDGWYWFESRDAACAFFGINPEQKEV